MISLDQNLAIIWAETTDNGGGGRRYVAKSLDGGHGWGVYDRRAKRFLKDREVARLDADQLREPQALS